VRLSTHACSDHTHADSVAVTGDAYITYIIYIVRAPPLAWTCSMLPLSRAGGRVGGAVPPPGSGRRVDFFCPRVFSLELVFGSGAFDQPPCASLRYIEKSDRERVLVREEERCLRLWSFRPGLLLLIATVKVAKCHSPLGGGPCCCCGTFSWVQLLRNYASPPRNGQSHKTRGTSGPRNHPAPSRGDAGRRAYCGLTCAE